MSRMHHAHPPTVEPLTSDVNVDVTEADIADAQRYAYEIWWSDEDSAYLGRAEEMPGTMSHGDTPEEALSMTIEAQALALVAMRHWNRYVPPPREKVSVVTIRELGFDQPPTLTADDVRAVRERLGYSQTVFATALGVDAGTVRSWEQGTRNVSGAARRLIQAIDTRPHILAEWAVERR
ncbi:MAG: helix-turn-helix domain-containing protein [Thermomicrobiales bacterium]|jgi:putative transcriptional regulator